MGSETLGLSSRVLRAAQSLQMQSDEPVVSSYGLARTATLTMLGDGRGEGDERERREAAEEGAAAEEAAEQVARRGELAARDCARAEHLPRREGKVVGVDVSLRQGGGGMAWHGMACVAGCHTWHYFRRGMHARVAGQGKAPVRRPRAPRRRARAAATP